MAAEQNHFGAQYELGMSYLKGDGVDKDEKKAFELFEKAALKGDNNAQYQLALCYQHGKGTNKDFVKAYAWLKIASVGSGAEIQAARDGLMEQLTPEQLTQGSDLSDELMQQLLTDEFEIKF